MGDRIQVSFLQRKPGDQNFSLERIFVAVRENLPADIVPKLCTCPKFSNSIWARWSNANWARSQQSRVNHITGDVHYLAFAVDTKRTILTIADCVLLQKTTGIKRAIGKFLYFTGPIKRSRIVTTISEAAKQDIIRHTGCSGDKIKVIYVPPVFQISPDPKNFNESCPKILMIGSAWNKNLENQLKALEGIVCTVKLIGKPDPSILAVAKSLNLSFESLHGITETEMLQTYRDCDMLMFASLYEGFGMPIVEANMTGRPVITSNVSSMPEVAGEAACLVDPNSVESIREGVLKVISDEAYRNQLVNSGFENAKRFKLDTIVAQYVELYREVANSTGG